MFCLIQFDYSKEKMKKHLEIFLIHFSHVRRSQYQLDQNGEIT